ncbi:hypothetical protein Tco_0078409 [Tanacetum coccineum]
MSRSEPVNEAVFVKPADGLKVNNVVNDGDVDGKQDDTQVVKVVGVADEQNSDELNMVEGNGVIGVGANGNKKGVDKERLNDKYIKKKKMEAATQRRLWDPEIKSAFQDNTLRARCNKSEGWGRGGGRGIDGGSLSDNDARDQASELETKVLVDSKQDDAKVVKVEPVDKDVFVKSADGFKANKVVNDGDGELEKMVLLDGKQDDMKVLKVIGVADEQNSDEPYVLEGNGVFDTEVSNDSICSKSCLETVELLKSQNDQLLKSLRNSAVNGSSLYQRVLMSVEEKLKFYKANESIYLQDIKGLKFEIQIGEITIRELRKKLEIVQKEKDEIQLNVDKFEHASKRKFMPTTPDLSFTGLDEFVNKPVVENYKAMSSEEEPKVVRKYDDAPTVLVKSGLVSVNAARQNILKTAVLVNTTRQVNAAHSKTTVNASRPMSYLSKTTHSTVKRPIHKNTEFKNSNINQKVNTVRGKKFNTARPKAVVNVVKGNNVVKASACWVWKPKHKVLDHVSKHNSTSITLKSLIILVHKADPRVIDSGCSRHMTRNMFYLIDYEEIDGGYVAFGGNPKGRKITGKCTKASGLLSSIVPMIQRVLMDDGVPKLQVMME